MVFEQFHYQYRPGNGFSQHPEDSEPEDSGLDEIPKVGDRYELFGELWRVIEVSDRVVLTREPS